MCVCVCVCVCWWHRPKPQPLSPNPKPQPLNPNPYIYMRVCVRAHTHTISGAHALGRYESPAVPWTRKRSLRTHKRSTAFSCIFALSWARRKKKEKEDESMFACITQTHTHTADLPYGPTASVSMCIFVYVSMLPNTSLLLLPRLHPGDLHV